jgi:hypothetical protein
MNRAFGPLYKELTIKRLRSPTLFIMDESQLCANKGPRPTRKEVAVITMSATAQETRRTGLMELERRFCDNHTDAPYESRVHGVHEGDLPRHPFVGIQIS